MSLSIADGIMLCACILSKLTPDQIRAKNRHAPVARVRQAIMWALHHRSQWSYPQIARYVGVKDHTTVIHGVKKAPIMAEFDPDYDGMLAALKDAPAITPFALNGLLVEAGVIAAPPVPVVEKPDPAPAPVARKLSPRYASTAKRDRPRTPFEVIRDHRMGWEDAHVPGYHSFRMNASGNTVSDVVSADRMAAGSRKLLEAIRRELAA